MTISTRQTPRLFADERLTPALRCPRCHGRLRRDLLWSSSHWLCANGHSYSNLSVLLEELVETGIRPMLSPARS